MKGVGAKKFGISLETQGIKLFWRDIPGFCRDIPETPEKFEKKKFGLNFWPLFQAPCKELFLLKFLLGVQTPSLFCVMSWGLVRQFQAIFRQSAWPLFGYFQAISGNFWQFLAFLGGPEPKKKASFN